VGRDSVHADHIRHGVGVPDLWQSLRERAIPARAVRSERAAVVRCGSSHAASALDDGAWPV